MTMDRSGWIASKTGISVAHQQKLQRLAQACGLAFAFRPVDRMAMGLIAAGHPTKNFHIKGKSASWGPQGGLICRDQGFSKLEGRGSATIGKYRAQTESCIAAGHARPVPLRVTMARLDELRALGALREIRHQGDDRLVLSAIGPGSGAEYLFDAERQADGCYLVRHQQQVIEVLAPHDHSLPLTADYDLLLIAVPLADFGAQDTLPIPSVSYAKFNPRKNPVLGRLYPNAAAFYAREDPDLGNASARIRALIPQLNAVLDCAPGCNLVHHNSDAGSPATDPASNFPASFFLPFPIGIYGQIGMIENDNRFVDWILTLKDAGFHVPINPLWTNQLGLWSSAFTMARARLAARSMR